MTTRKPPARGISTVEVLVGAMLTLMLITAVYSTLQVQTRSFAAQSAYSQSQNVTRTLIDMMVREMRMIAYDPSDAALPVTVGNCPGVKLGILAATRTSVQFQQDLNGDGDVTDSGEVVSYSLVDRTVVRQDGANAPLVLVENVPADGLAFRYFDDGYPPAELVPAGGALTQNQRNCVAKIDITARAEVPHPDVRVDLPLLSVARSEVAIRNLSLMTF
jgi:Tfp pilus assembly protein PilV